MQGGAGLPDLLSAFRRSTRGGAWLQDTWQLGSRGSVQAGLRLDRAGITRETLLSPRVSASLGLGASTRLKGAVGRYTQSPGYEKLAQSDYVLDFTGDAVRALRSERSLQASAGVEQDLGRGVVLRVEGYRKRFTTSSSDDWNQRPSGSRASGDTMFPRHWHRACPPIPSSPPFPATTAGAAPTDVICSCRARVRQSARA